MKQIKLTHGHFALVDDEDYDYLNQWKWFADIKKHTIYAIRKGTQVNYKRKTIWMHRLIMNTPNNLEVDHIDHNGLNNQKFNLRNCTCLENRRNKSPRGKSKYLGVYLAENKYPSASINMNYKIKHLGFFKTEEEAAKAYDKKAKEYFGEFANLNFKD